MLSEGDERQMQRPRFSSVRVHAALKATRRCRRPQREHYPVRNRSKSYNSTAFDDSSSASDSERGCFDPPPGGLRPRFEAERRVEMRGCPSEINGGGINVNAHSGTGRTELGERLAPRGREGWGAGRGASSASRRSSSEKNQNVTTAEQELRDERRCVRLRLAAPAGERELSLAWTAASVDSFREEVTVEPFTPGGWGGGVHVGRCRNVARAQRRASSRF